MNFDETPPENDEPNTAPPTADVEPRDEEIDLLPS